MALRQENQEREDARTQSQENQDKISHLLVGDDDVSIKVKYTGICHSDIHHSKDEWGLASKPAVPGILVLDI